MPKIIKNNTDTSLDKFGEEFQYVLVNQIITNLKKSEDEPEFSKNVLEEIEPTMFSIPHGGYIVSLLKEYYVKHNVLPKDGFKALKYLIQSKSDILKIRKTNSILRELILIEQAYVGINNEVRDSYIQFIDMKKISEMKYILDIAERDGDLSKALELSNVIQHVISKREKKKYVVYDLMENIDKVFESTNAVNLSTGFGDLFDYYLDGGYMFSKNYMYVIGKNTGKTTTVCKKLDQFCLKHNKKAVLFYWEDDLVEIISKVVSSNLGVSIGSLSTQKDYRNSEEYKRVQELKKQFNGNCKLVEMTLGSSIQDVINIVYSLINDGFNPEVILLDYYSKLSGIKGRKYENNYEHIGEAMDMMTDLCKVLNCIGLGFQQTGREGINSSNVYQKNIRGDISALFSAHGVFVYSQTDSQKREKVLNLLISSLRGKFSGAKIENMKFDGSCMEIESGEAPDANWEERTVEYWKKKGIVV